MQARGFSRQLLPVHRFGAVAVLAVLVCLCVPEKSAGTYLVFTIDVYWTCGSDFQGTWEGKDYGVPLLAEKLEQYGLKGTFFVSPLCPHDLTDTMFSNLRFLVSRGHDVELHPHPDSIDFSRLLMTMYAIEERRKILQTAIDNIKRRVLHPPLPIERGPWQ